MKKICDYPVNGPKTTEARTLLLGLSEMADSLVAERGNAFIDWASQIGAVRYTLSESETSNALKAYFLGEPPLKEAKIRKDIPDSFIYQSLLRINDKNPLHVVVEDGKLREACETSGMVCYKELTSFIENQDVKALLKGKIEDDVLEAIEFQILEYLNLNNKLLIDKVEEKLLTDEYSMLSGDSILGESNEIYLSGVNKPSSINISQNVEHYGDALFVVYFSSRVEFIYEYAVYKSDAYDLDPKKYHLENLNDHYFNVETTDEFDFSGRIELEYDISLESVESVTG